MHIFNRILRHSRRQRSLCPIRLLRTLQKCEAEITFHQRSEAKFSNSKKTSCDHCVEDPARNQIQTAPQHSQIVVGAVQNNFFGLQRTTKRSEIDVGQWIENEVARIPALSRITLAPSCINAALHSGDAYLKQTKFFSIRMQAVRFSIDCDAIGRFYFPYYTRASRGVRNHVSRQRNPLRSNSALVLVACRLSINFSIASKGGSADIVLRNISTRSHSSG